VDTARGSKPQAHLRGTHTQPHESTQLNQTEMGRVRPRKHQHQSEAGWGARELKIPIAQWSKYRRGATFQKHRSSSTARESSGVGKDGEKRGLRVRRADFERKRDARVEARDARRDVGRFREVGFMERGVRREEGAARDGSMVRTRVIDDF
jgi:hypothetical protein